MPSIVCWSLVSLSLATQPSSDFVFASYMRTTVCFCLLSDNWKGIGLGALLVTERNWFHIKYVHTSDAYNERYSTKLINIQRISFALISCFLVAKKGPALSPFPFLSPGQFFKFFSSHSFSFLQFFFLQFLQNIFHPFSIAPHREFNEEFFYDSRMAIFRLV